MERANNDQIWAQVQATDPAYTKTFSRGGGFSGTAINATYMAKKATETFGPMGLGWGVDILNEKFQEGAPLGFDSKGNCLGREIIHILRVELWYVHGDKRGVIKQFGQTTFVGKNKYGTFTDEEAPKKSLTDGMTKCLSLLGFGADVHLGLYDDNKYVTELKKGFAEQQQQTVELVAASVVLATAHTAAVEPVFSERYSKYLARINGKVIRDIKTARSTIEADDLLTSAEKSILLAMPSLVGVIAAPVEDPVFI